MGSLFKSSGSSVSDPGAEQAWAIAKPTQQYLNTAGTSFTQDVMNNPAYLGQRVAALNPYSINAANSLGTFAQNTGTFGANAMTGSGFNNLMAGNNYGNNAQSIFNASSGDPTGQILSNANQYANNPYINGLIDASSRDITRNLYENQIPGINRAASGTGNINSSRAGVQQGIAERGAGDRLADLSSSIRSQFFGQGLNMAQNQYNQNLSNMLSANNGLLNAGNYGMNLMNAGQQYAGNAFNQGNTAGTLFQAQNQNELDANKAVFDESMANRLAALQALSGIAGNTQAKTSAGVVQQPSIISQLAGAAAAGIGAYSKSSDIRTKENIKKIGVLPSGLNVYEYEYKPEFKNDPYAGHGKFIGVMAQEVKEIIPDAIITRSDGYMMVDYSKVH